MGDKRMYKRMGDNSPKWMSKRARCLRKSKLFWWKRYRISQDYNDLLEYKRVRNMATAEYRNAKKAFELKLATSIKNDSKSFYSYVRSKSKTKAKVGPLKTNSGNLVVNNNEMCTVLNEFFSSVFVSEGSDNLPELDPVFKDDPGNKLFDVCVDKDVVQACLLKLKSNKAAGVDGFISTLFLRLNDCLAYPLSIIFSKSLCGGVVPMDWKRANVTAVFKGGSKHEPSNYRPISLTVQACKLLETILKHNITKHLCKHGLINDDQHGFVERRSCLTNLLTFLDDVHNTVDKGIPVDVVFLDFRKAFDRVPHKRLLSKVRAHGIDGCVYNWIESWLHGREQRVVLNGCTSEWKKVLSGVPQGSVLGPLLFLLYVNDLHSDVINKLLKFADDAKLFGSVGTTNDINSLQALCLIWKVGQRIG